MLLGAKPDTVLAFATPSLAESMFRQAGKVAVATA